MVQICGKNLWGGTIELGGIRIETGDNDGASDRVRTKEYVSVEASTEYAISGIYGSRYALFYDANKSYLGYELATNRATQGTFTTVQNTRYVRWYVIPIGTSPDTSIKEQLELGSTATAYEPYQDQSYEVNLGKNLFDPAIAAHPSGMPNNLGETLRVDTNATYTFNVGNDRTFAQVQLFDNTGTRTRTLGNSASDHTLTFTTASSEVSGLFCFYPGQSGVDPTTYDYTGVQLEKGSTATDFAPYFTPIELCKIGDYQDYIYKSGGKWYLRKEVGKKVLTRDNMDNLSVLQRTSGYQFDFANSGAHIGDLTGYWFYCERFARNYFNNRDNIVNSIYGYTDSRVRILTNVATDTSGFKDWVEANSPIIYYVLATPTDTEITNEALIAQLEALLTTARTYTGINNIFTITPNEQGTLEIGYYTKYQPMVGSGGYVWEAGGAGGPTVIMNNSIDSVSPVWTIYGPTTNPQLENATTGETIEYVGTIAQGQTLTIDMGEQTASLDGLNVISNLVGDFVQLAPGRNNIIYSVSGEAGASELGWSEIVG